MVDNIIKEINKCLENGCYIAALTMALTLPDICGKAKYPTDGNKKRYIAWYDEYVGAYEQCPGDEGQMPYLSGEVVYQLRCSFLHQGNPNIDKEKIHEECCKIDKFTLLVENKNDFEIYTDSSSVGNINDLENNEEGTYRTYEVNIRRLCLIISLSAEDYYEKNKQLFDFFNFNVVDLEKRKNTYLKIKDKYYDGI